jgi:hypothetical protein
MPLPFTFIEEVRALGIRIVGLQADDPIDSGNCREDPTTASSGWVAAGCIAPPRLGCAIAFEKWETS